MTTSREVTKQDFVPGSRKLRGSLASLRQQMADAARGNRIAELRDRRRLTQEAVVEGLQEQEGRKVISLRGYQEWEAGGGIKWENAKILARYFEVDPESVVSRKGDETPDALATLNGRPADEKLAAQVAHTVEARVIPLVATIETQLRELQDQLDRLLSETPREP